VQIYYGGDGPIEELFETEAEAQAFYEAHDMCGKPERWIADTYDKIDWAEAKIATRIAAEYDK
jgi:hypothetical protein